MVRERPLSAGAIAGAFPVSRPAVSRHLRVLRAAGLVKGEASGRERVYRLEPGPLRALEEFVVELRTACDRHAEWDRRFMALETEIYRTRAKRKRSANTAPIVHAKRQSK